MGKEVCSNETRGKSFVRELGSKRQRRAPPFFFRRAETFSRERRRRRRRSSSSLSSPPLTQKRRRQRRMFSSLIHPMRRSDKALASLKVKEDDTRAPRREGGPLKGTRKGVKLLLATSNDDDAPRPFPEALSTFSSPAFPLSLNKRGEMRLNSCPWCAEKKHSQHAPRLFLLK